MIKFFRKIRQKLLSEKKFSKYLLYAIGEIVLVVIGILIALQISNWNENRKDSIYKKKLVNNLMLDLRAAKSDLASSIQDAEKGVNYGDLFMEITGNKNESIPVDSIKTLAKWSTSKILFKLTLSNYDGSKSSGKLSLLDNREVLNGYSEIFVGLEDYLHHFPIADREFYSVSVWEFKKKHVSLTVLTKNPDTLNWNILQSLYNMDKSIRKLIEILEGMILS